jgi:voltage-gated potassium channel
MSEQQGRPSLRRRLYLQLEPHARPGVTPSPVNFAIILLVVASFVVYALETEPTLSNTFLHRTELFNLVILCVFAFEYVVRFWVAGEEQRYRGVRGRIRWFFTPYAFADLLAFLPELLWLSMGAPDQSDRVLMILKVLRLLRLLKIVHYVPAFEILGAAVRRSAKQLLTTLAVTLVIVYLSAVLLYFIEGLGQGREEFASIPRAIWWAVATLTTVGYGDVYPVTVLGRVAAGIIALAGVGVVALPAGVFASAFTEELRNREKTRCDPPTLDG